MAMPKEMLKRKALGIVQAIDSMSANERASMPTALFGEDYNKLRAFVAESDPTLTQVMPPAVDIAEYGMGGERFSTQRYSEIRSFCQQLVKFLE
jgi:hypothetical protein